MPFTNAFDRAKRKRKPQNKYLRTISAATLFHFSLFTLHSSLFTFILPPSGREGDREAGEGARGCKSREKDIIAGGYGIRPYGKRQSDGHSFLPPSGREGDREAVEGACGYESNDLPFMRCLPLFSSVGTEMSSLLCAFSFRHPCGAGRRGKATAPCSHPGGSRSDSRRQADMESAPTEIRSTIRIDRNTESVGSNRFSVGEEQCHLRQMALLPPNTGQRKTLR